MLKHGIVRVHEGTGRMSLLLEEDLAPAIAEAFVVQLPWLSRKKKHARRIHEAFSAVESAMRQQTVRLP